MANCPKPPCVDKAAKADSARAQFDSAYAVTPSPDPQHLQTALRLQQEAGTMEMIKAALRSLVERRSALPERKN